MRISPRISRECHPAVTGLGACLHALLFVIRQVPCAAMHQAGATARFVPRHAFPCHQVGAAGIQTMTQRTACFSSTGRRLYTVSHHTSAFTLLNVTTNSAERFVIINVRSGFFSQDMHRVSFVIRQVLLACLSSDKCTHTCCTSGSCAPV